MKPVQALESKILELDLLLDRIGIKLQLSPTTYQLAEERYITIGKWLRAQGSALSDYKPWIFSQGSLRIGTTVKPRGRTEFDLDLVCLVFAELSQFPNPTNLLDIVEQRLNESEIYKTMIERKNRCIRINYANQFHMDILPACPNPLAKMQDENCIVVPDCKSEDWKHSNPKGYAQWFEKMTQEAVTRLQKNMEPLPSQQSYEELATLRRVVQLLKRYRDVSLEKIPENRRPISIVLTTLAAHLYQGQASVSDAMAGILNGMLQLIENCQTKKLIVKNPTNENEDLSERWEDDPEAYQIFVKWVTEFRAKWLALANKRGIHNVKQDLEIMFGERIAREVIEERIKEIGEERKSGLLGVEKGSGIIVSSTVASSTPIKSNTFFGGNR